MVTQRRLIFGALIVAAAGVGVAQLQARPRTYTLSHREAMRIYGGDEHMCCAVSPDCQGELNPCGLQMTQPACDAHHYRNGTSGQGMDNRECYDPGCEGNSCVEQGSHLCAVELYCKWVNGQCLVDENNPNNQEFYAPDGCFDD